MKLRLPDYLFIILLSSVLALTNIAVFSDGISEIFVMFSVQIALGVLLLTIFSFNKAVLKVFSGILLFFAMLSMFCYHQFGIVIDEMVILSIFDNVDNFTAISIFTVFIYVFVFCVAIILIIKLKIVGGNLLKKSIAFGCSVVILTGFVTIKDRDFLKNFFSIYAPENVVVSLVQYTGKIIKNSHLEIRDLNETFKFENHNNSPINVILIIGESARSDHFSLNGYPRKTNPLLVKKNNLISFKNVTPCANATSYSVPCILSHQNRDEFFKTKYQYTNLISVFNNLGFSTHWFSVQSAFGNQNMILKNALQAKFIKMKSSYRSLAHDNNNLLLDEFLFADLENTLKKSGNNFIILHTNGSHFPLDHFISSKFIKFEPACFDKTPQNCKKRDIINAYDNTILYTDFFLSKVVDDLKNTNSIVIYVSDHGAFLGEEGKFYHGNKGDYEKPEHKVPMILWMSDTMMKNTKFKNNFQNAAKKINDNLSHDNIFYSVLGCVGISHNITDKQHLNICK